MPRTDGTNDILCIGDYITLKSSLYNAYLSSEGILTDHCSVSENFSLFEDNIFQITIQRQYSAANELEEFIQTHGPERVRRDPSFKKHLRALSRGQFNELKMNHYMQSKRKFGNQVTLGETIQLFHVKSMKYLTVFANEPARDERANLTVGLDPNGSTTSWIQFSPRYKIDQEGDSVTNGMEVYLSVVDRPGESIHCADEKPARGRPREVNSSMDLPTSWKISIYHRAQEIRDSSLSLTGQLIYLKDPESGTLLVPFSQPILIDTMHVKRNPKRKGNYFNADDESSLASVGSLSTIHMLEQGDGMGDDSEEERDGDNSSNSDTESLSDDETASTLSGDSKDQEPPPDYGDVALQETEEEDIDSNAIWMLEAENRELGGPVSSSSGLIQLRHFNTGRYLGFSFDPPTKEYKLILTYQGKRSEKRCLFTAKSVADNGDFLLNEKAITIRLEKSSFLMKGDWDSNVSVFPLLSTKEAHLATSFLMCRYVDSEEEEEEEEGAERNNSSTTTTTILKVDSPVDEKFPADIFVGKSIVSQLKILLFSVRLPDAFNSTILSIWPDDDHNNSKLFMMIIDCCVAFIYGEQLIADPHKNNTTKPTISTSRQKLLKEQGLIEIILKTLHTLIPVSEALTKLRATETKTKAANTRLNAPSTRSIKGALGMGKAVISKCLQLLLVLIRNNTDNQKIVANHLFILVEHIASDSITVRTMQEVLGSNKDLQEQKISLDEIIAFTRKLRNLPMNPHVLNLLSSTCWVYGSEDHNESRRLGISKNQQIVFDVLFRKYRKLVITLKEDSNRHDSTSWDIPQSLVDLFLPQSEVLKSHVSHLDLYSQGPCSLSIGWEVPPKQTQYSMRTLFDSDSLVPLQEVFSPSNPRAFSLKKDVGTFLVSQLLLAGDMCLGRNYRVMAELSKKFPFSSLLDILKTDLPTEIKGSAARLFTFLYVDCEPQMQVFLPRMTRMWSEVGSSNYSQPIGLLPERSVQFAVLQLIVSEHLHSLENRPYSGCTSSYMLLLSKLLEFNFYGNQDQLVEVVNSILTALDRRNMIDERDQKKDQFLDQDVHEQEADHHHDHGLQQLSFRPQKRLSLSMSRKVNNPIKLKGNQAMETNEELEGESEPTSLIEKITKYFSNINYNEEYNYFLLRTLLTLESLPAMLTVMSLVFIAIAEAIYVYLKNPVGIAWTIFEYYIFAVFACDVSLRCFCHMSVRGPFSTFISDVFNQIDFAVVGLDVIVFAIGGILGSAGGFTRALRALRLLRLFRVLRAMRMVNRMMNFKNFKAWTLPHRYDLTSKDEPAILTAAQMLEVLSTVQTIVEDTALSHFLHSFHEWQANNSIESLEAEVLAPQVESNILKIFEQSSHAASTLKLSNVDYNDILIDLLMYGHPILVQNTLNVIMKHNTSTCTLLNNLEKLQLLIGSNREEEYLKMDKVVTQLTKQMDTFEIWSAFTEPSHYDTKKSVFETMNYLIQVCQKPMFVLEIGETTAPDEVVQNILFHLGCFEVCMKFLKTLNTNHTDPSEFNYQTNPSVEKFRSELIQMTNKLIYWMILDNKDIQPKAFDHLELFISSVDANIGSDRIIRAIFRNNIVLVKRCPKHYLSHFVNLICEVGRFPQYFSILSSVCIASGENVMTNQYEVIRLLSAMKNQKQVVLYFVPSDHPDYQKKLNAMLPLAGEKDISIEDLSVDLQYHLQLIYTLSCCSVGNEGMTSIDAKIQSMFPFHYAFQALNDPNTLLIIKIRLGQFIFNALLDVELRLPGLVDAECVWTFLESVPGILIEGQKNLEIVSKKGWSSPEVHRQAVEFAIVSAQLVYGYFHFYFESAIFRSNEMGNAVAGVERMKLKESQAMNLMQHIFNGITCMYQMTCPHLSTPHQTILYNALVSINNSMKTPLVPSVQLLHSLVPSSAIQDLANSDEEDPTGVRAKYIQFLSVLRANESIQKSIEESILEFTQKLDELPMMADLADSDVRFESIILRLVKHVDQCVKIQVFGDETSKSMDPQATRTSIWVLRVFRTTIQNKWGMTLEERDEQGGEEQDVASEALIKVYMSCGMVDLCFNLIAIGLDNDLQIEAMKLLAAMLLRDGGAIEIQNAAFQWLSGKSAENFFARVRHIIDGLISWHKNQQLLATKTGILEARELPEVIIILRLLQLLCEGHNEANQNILRTQPNNNSVNLLDCLVSYFNELDNIHNETSIDAALAIAELILESVQGPCVENQIHLAKGTELLETLNRKMRRFGLSDEEKKIELMSVVIDIYKGLLEGQGSNPEIYERILSVVHLDMLKTICLADEDEIILLDDDEEEPEDPRFDLKISSLVVLNMLCGYKPSVRDEIDFHFGSELHQGLRSKNPKNNQLLDSIRSVELIWRNQLQRVYFHVPEICDDLAKTTKDEFVVKVDRQSEKSKLYGLLDAAPKMYREIKHHQLLKEWKAATIFSKSTQDFATWFSFTIACLINILFLFYYYAKIVPCSNTLNAVNGTAVNGTRRVLYDLEGSLELDPENLMTSEGRVLKGGGGGGGGSGGWNEAWPDTIVCSYVVLNPKIIPVIHSLTYLLIVCSLYSLVLYLMLNVPMTYQNFIASKQTVLRAALLTALDPMTLYYFGYFFFALFGLWLHDLLLFLPLDIIINSDVARGVMDAVWKPRKVLTMTMILNLIIIYIFAAFAFFMYDNSKNFVDPRIDSSLKLVFYDFLHLGSPYGVQLDLIVNLNSWRWFSDFAFFLAMFTTWNIIRGITIDTFMEQRSEYDERMKDTLGCCFICGIEKNVFKRTLNSEAYRRHIALDHNLWSYLYFIVYIWEQDKNDDDGLASYIRKCLKENDLSWFPSGKSIRLNAALKLGGLDDEEDSESLLKEEMDEYQSSLINRMSAFSESFGKSVARFETLMNNGSDQGAGEVPQFLKASSSDQVEGQSQAPPPPTTVPNSPNRKRLTSTDRNLADRSKLRTESIDAIETHLRAFGGPSSNPNSLSPRLFLKVHTVSGLHLNESDLLGIYCRVTSMSRDHIITPSTITMTNHTHSLDFDPFESELEVHRWSSLESAASETGVNASFLRIQVAALQGGEGQLKHHYSPETPSLSNHVPSHVYEVFEEEVAKSIFVGVVYVPLGMIRTAVLADPDATIILPFTQKWKNEQGSTMNCKVIFSARLLNS